MPSGDILVTQEEMYKLLLEVRDSVRDLATLPKDLADHEARIRLMESQVDQIRKVHALETRLTNIERKVWALPSAATVIAAASLIVVLITKF